jgi:hypothetical protein
MIRRLIIICIFACIGAFPVFAGDTLVSGSVSGVWHAWQSIDVKGPIWIASDASLHIEYGVQITFETTDSVNIDGKLIAEGTTDAPIMITVPDGWNGFNFVSNEGTVNRLTAVRIGTAGGIPKRVVRSWSTLLDVSDCEFQAERSCLEINGGRIRAYRNSFTTTAMQSTAVQLQNLTYGSFPSDPCNDPESSQLASNNVIQAIVPYVTIYPGPYFTTGLEVINCTRLCLDSVNIKVDAPGLTTGAHFQNTITDNPPSFTLRHSNILVRSQSPRSQPVGLKATEGGIINVISCTVDVANPQDTTFFLPRGVVILANATVYINSSIIQLDKGDHWLFPTEGAAGTITATHVDLWSGNATLSGASLPIPPGPDDRETDGGLGTRLNKQALIEQEPIYYADPQFVGSAENWTSLHTPDEIQAYYSLKPTSPCIDHGDAFYGMDPDGTPPDIGSFYRDQSQDSTISDVGDDGPVPSNLALNLPYPNPFNSTVVVPFELNRNGNVSLVVYDVLGRRVAVLASEFMATGRHEVHFTGYQLSSGLYFVAMDFNGSRIAHRPMLLVK